MKNIRIRNEQKKIDDLRRAFVNELRDINKMFQEGEINAKERFELKDYVWCKPCYAEMFRSDPEMSYQM